MLQVIFTYHIVCPVLSVIRCIKYECHNGSLLYTLKPIEPIEERYFQQVLAEQASKNAVQNALARYEEKRANTMKGVTANENV